MRPIFHPFPLPPKRPARSRRITGWLLVGGMWLTGILLTVWAAGALYYDLPAAAWRTPVAILYAVVVLGVAIGATGRWRAFACAVAGFLIVLIWWRTLRPSNDRAWQPDVAQTPWAEVEGERVTLHNVRNCEYRTETDYTPRWETRTVDLSHLRGIDLAINYWGSSWMAHPIVCFRFDDTAPVCFSVETRKALGETYSAIGGLYRQYELVYVCAEERDVLRVRTNYRKGEEVYLYHTTVSPEQSRDRFLEYVASINTLHSQPRWYNAATTNCTTSIRTQRDAAQRAPWDWRILVNGYGDQLLYERGVLAGNLPFADLKKQARINDAARAANDDPNFSQRIRAGRPGFEPIVAHQ